MSRQKYVLILPTLLLLAIAAGFGLSSALPRLPAYAYLLYAVCIGAIIVAVDRVARRKVAEPLVDERIKGLSHEAAWIAYRVVTILVAVGGFIIVFAFQSVEALKFIGMGALVAVALQALIYWISYVTIQRRHS